MHPQYHSARAVYAFAVALLPYHSVRQRDGGVRTPQALNRLLVEKEEVQWSAGSSARVVLPPMDARSVHVRDILHTDNLRAGVADQFLVDKAPLTILDDLSIQIDMPPELRRPPPPPPPVTLMLAMPRPKVLQRLLPHISAIGVQHIVLCGAYKVEKGYWASDIIKDPGIGRAALLEGVMQAGMDCLVPSFTAERFLKPFLEDRLHSFAGPGVLRLIAEPDMKGTRIADVVQAASKMAASKGCRKALLAVGPEGGWMPRELDMLVKQHDFVRVTLGSRILKTDAAVIILLGMLNDALRRVEESDPSNEIAVEGK